MHDKIAALRSIFAHIKFQQFGNVFKRLHFNRHQTHIVADKPAEFGRAYFTQTFKARYVGRSSQIGKSFVALGFCNAAQKMRKIVI